jgi:CubicO group peptidase (beta-lactamase class C family)
MNNRLLPTTILFTLYVLVFAPCMAAQERPRLESTIATDNIWNLLKARETSGFCGVLLIRYNHKDLFHEAFGFRDRESSERMSLAHGFDIGSLVKPVTAVAILRLEQDGLLQTSDSIATYFGKIPEDKQPITLQHLLDHKAGLPDIFGDDYSVVDKSWFLDQVLNCQLIADVGQREQYSNAGYSLLACVIEQVTGDAYEKYVREKVLMPAETPGIGYILCDWKNDDLAVGYRGQERWGTPRDKAWADDGPSWNLRGNGGMLATATDMCKWYEALIDGKIVNRKQLEKFYGMMGGQSKSTGSRLLGHAGGNDIFNTLQISFVDLDFHLTLFTSVSDQQAETIWKDLQEDVIGLAKQAAGQSTGDDQ